MNDFIFSRNKIYKKILVHRFDMFKVSEDPELEAAEKLYEWRITPMGEFVLKHSFNKPEYRFYLDYETGSHKCDITAELEEKRIAEYYLRWGNF